MAVSSSARPRPRAHRSLQRQLAAAAVPAQGQRLPQLLLALLLLLQLLSMNWALTPPHLRHLIYQSTRRRWLSIEHFRATFLLCCLTHPAFPFQLAQARLRQLKKKKAEEEAKAKAEQQVTPSNGRGCRDIMRVSLGDREEARSLG